MKQENNSTQNLIEEVIETLQQEMNSMQIVGRALTPFEMKRIDLLGQTIGNLKMILQPVEEDEPTTGGSY
jgi:pseudouridine-5'-phosphate glycosidase